ncbi:MAG TPA: Asp-tRNA(Asn)/Glu-tRNA(Gln) amidotransferase subunit GatC [bacterium]|nr:Asp-tRNA(Asn)/Glu-tRNA(Gln) amidotransferase subunit GatC [bacterium]
MSISLDQVRHIALLARLEFGDTELEKFASQLNSILQYAEKINELDTESVMPTAHAIPMANVFREDEVKPSLPVEQALQNAPVHNKATFIVPKVAE